MAINVGINGYGRIGRNILRALYESGRDDEAGICLRHGLENREATRGREALASREARARLAEHSG